LFKEARRLYKKTFWRAENGHYALYVNNIKVELPTDSETDDD